MQNNFETLVNQTVIPNFDLDEFKDLIHLFMQNQIQAMDDANDQMNFTEDEYLQFTGRIIKAISDCNFVYAQGQLISAYTYVGNAENIDADCAKLRHYLINHYVSSNADIDQYVIR